jgi:hypothetical protein
MTDHRLRFTETDLTSKFFKSASIQETALRMYLDAHDVKKEIVDDLVARVRNAQSAEAFVSVLHEAADVGTAHILGKEARDE